MTQQIEPHLLNRFRVVKKMGSGAYGHVFKVIDRSDQKTKALKKNFDAFTNSTDAQRTYREIMFLYQLNHPNIVGLLDVFKASNGKDIYILFEYMEADLFEVTRARNILTDKHRKFILYQIAKAIFYLHSAGIVHRDLKPANILLNEQCEAKICDFGLVRSVEDHEDSDDEEDNMTEYIATRWYRAPQILLGSKVYSKAVDIWSFGCIAVQIFTGKSLFPGNSTLNQIQRVLKWTGVPSLGDLKALKTQFGKHLIDIISTIKPISKNETTMNIEPLCCDLIDQALVFNPCKRASIQQILKHKYFQEFFNPAEMIESKKKVKIPIKDSVKLSLKQYRSLIYEQISKNNIKHKDFSISRIRSHSFKTEDNAIRNTSTAVKKATRSISHDNEPKKSVKTIKKYSNEASTAKKTFFNQSAWQYSNSRAPSREGKHEKVILMGKRGQVLRKGHNYKLLKSGVTKPKLQPYEHSHEKFNNRSMPLK